MGGRGRLERGLPSRPPVFKGEQAATTSQGKWLAQDISWRTPRVPPTRL